jgi:hypothetical protein
VTCQSYAAKKPFFSFASYIRFKRKAVKIAYIDDDEVRATAFYQAARQVNVFADCELFKDRARTVKYIMDTLFVPHYIFIHLEFKEVPCETVVNLIKKQTHLDNTKVIIVSDHFTRTDGLLFNELNVTTRLVRTDELTAALSDIFKSENVVFRALPNK